MNSVLHQATELHAQGQLGEAERLYRSVLETNPDQADAFALLGLLLGEQQHYKEALDCVQHALALDPETALFHFYLGKILNDKGDGDQAEKAFTEALKREPNFVEARYALALLLEKQEKYQEAALELKQLIKIKPTYGAAFIALSDIARKNENYKEALDAAERALKLMPESLSAYLLQATALDFLDREEEAVTALENALRVSPDFIEARAMLGVTYQHLGELDKAESILRKVIEMAGASLKDEKDHRVREQDYSIHHWNLALLELLRGNFEDGFAHYRARFKNPLRPQRLAFPRPLWNGENLNGKKILVVSEQGFGDVLMMCRYGPLLKAQGAQVTLLVDKALVSLLEKTKLFDALLSEAPGANSDFDFQTSLFDLPHYLHTTPQTIPAEIPYIPAPQDLRHKLPSAHQLNIGVVWKGHKSFGNDRRRSVPIALFSKLFEHKNAQFFNLTLSLSPQEKDILTRHGVSDLSSKLDDFLATASFVAQCDLIISCDTAVAHLAGAMGKKVWLLLSYTPDWRWQTKREDSPWYPTMRLFRQNQKANWQEVIERASAALEKFFS